jgi:hypothetical protein
MTPEEGTGTKYRGLSPHKITPMLGVLQRRPRVDVFEVESRSRGPAEPGRSVSKLYDQYRDDMLWLRHVA